MENVAIARVLAEIGDLLEIRGDNPFKVRAYRNASQVIRDCGERVAALSPADLRGLPGIGKDIATRVTELVETGGSTFHRELAAEFPAGPARRPASAGRGAEDDGPPLQGTRIGSVDELKQALDSGRRSWRQGNGPGQGGSAPQGHRGPSGLCRTLPGVGGMAAGARADHASEDRVSRTPRFDLVGSLRRGAETCGDLDVLATGAGPEVMDHFVVVRPRGACPRPGADQEQRAARQGPAGRSAAGAAASRGAALQYFTGSKAHNIELRDRALRQGLKLNEYGLFRVEDDTRVAGDTEASIYEALGLPWIAPELREQRGEFEAARDGRLPLLVERDDLRGDLHCHTTATDGKDTIRAMALAARDAGLSYLAITDHSQALAMANGLDEHRALAHAAQVRAIGDEIDGITLLAGIECDIRADGTMDLADDCLAQLDVVVASVHSALSQEPERMTERVLRALECPYVDVLGHPTGRMLLRREASGLDVEAVDRAGRAPRRRPRDQRPATSPRPARRARPARRDRGVKIVLSSDAHARRRLRAPALGHVHRTPRLAHAAGRADLPAARGVARLAAPPPEPRMTVLEQLRAIYFNATQVDDRRRLRQRPSTCSSNSRPTRIARRLRCSWKASPRCGANGGPTSRRRQGRRDAGRPRRHAREAAVRSGGDRSGLA